MNEVKKLSKKNKIILAIYTFAVIYFMFFGFSRPQIVGNINQYRFQIIPTGNILRYREIQRLSWMKIK